MATNKNASYRYRVIDNCLKNTARKWTLDDLIETISEKLEEDLGIYKGVSKRTVQSDISIMRSMYPRVLMHLLFARMDVIPIKTLIIP
jgi:hypothetical protein